MTKNIEGDYNTAFEIVAKMFEKDTGMLAPGKDSVEHHWAKRSQAFKEWEEINKRHVQAVYDILTPNT